MRNMFTLLAFLASAAVLGWLATRAPSKWRSLILVGFLAMALVLGLAVGLDNVIQLFKPVSYPVASDESTKSPEQIGQIQEFVRFCGGCHTTDHLVVANDSASASSSPSLVLMPSEIRQDSNQVGIEELMAYSIKSGPDLEIATSNWSEADFIQTIRTGQDPRSHRLAHEMPWKDISSIATDDDLRTYYKYLHGLMSNGN